MTAADLRAKVAPARRELQAGHYAAAEALFRQLALTVRGVQPAADLCAALRRWERGEFAQATAIFQRFVTYPPPPQFAWLNDEKPLAQNRLDDYQLYADWEKGRGATTDLEVALGRIRAVAGKLKARGALTSGWRRAAKIARRFRNFENPAAQKRRAPPKKRPDGKSHHGGARALAAYRFENAVSILSASSTRLAQAERDGSYSTRAGWQSGKPN